MADTEQILADPSAHTVEDVVGALAGVSPDEVAVVKEREAAGKGRSGILNYEHPQAKAPTEFRTDEQHPVSGWRERHGWFGVSPHAVAGALADAEPGETFSQEQVAKRIEQFLKRKAT